jgi:hypothetical protein
MPTIMILDIPEFQPIVETAAAAGMTLRPAGDYVEAISPTPEISLRREITGVRPAIWFAALTGGLVGRYRQFDHDILTISD